ncbi:MAG: phage protein GemA/Gp16 family protein [Rhodoferax sp.]
MSKPATRPNHLAAIHMAQKALMLSADDATALKLAVTGKASAGDMSEAQRRQYLAHLAGLQSQMAQARGDKPPFVPRRAALHRTVDDSQDVRWGKARALWAALAQSGQVHTDTDAALMAYVRRQTHVEHWRFLNTHQVNQVIEALKCWGRRAQAPAVPPNM